MSYISERREDDKERRRCEILDATEALYIEKGWEGLSVEQVARSARLSRALVYVYFRDKEDLHFAVGARALRLLRKRFEAAAATRPLGLDQIEALVRAYMGYAAEFPHYFDFCLRFQAQEAASDPNTNEGYCKIENAQVHASVMASIDQGIRDGSIRSDIGHPHMFAFALWAFAHGLIQLATVKSGDLLSYGIAVPTFQENALLAIRRMAEMPKR